MLKKLNWGLIGGGEGSQIGEAHRIAAGLDSTFELVAGALDLDPTSGRDYATRKGVPASRAYGDWREMLQSERSRDGARPTRPDHGRNAERDSLRNLEGLSEKPASTSCVRSR